MITTCASPQGTRWTKAADVVQAQMGPGQTALLHMKTGQYHALNEVGSRIWILLDHLHSLEDLCTVLSEEYDVDPARCAEEVASYLATLHTSQLIEAQP